MSILAYDINVHYGSNHAIRSLSMEIPEKSVTAFIGASGCGKSHIFTLF